MVINLTVLALKAPLNAVFMYGWGPIDAMGGAGAGVVDGHSGLARASAMSARDLALRPLLRPLSQHGAAWTALDQPA